MDAILGVLHKCLNVYYGALLLVGIGFFGMSLLSGPFLVFSNQQVADASLVFFVFGVVALLFNNVLGSLGREIDTSDTRPGWLDWLGRWAWAAIVYAVHACLLAAPLYIGYGILYK